MGDLFIQDNENALISIIIKNPGLIFSVEKLKPFMLSSTSNQVIFAALLDLSKQNLSADFSLLSSYLDSKKWLEKAGGKEYLQYLFTLNFDETNLKFYEGSIVESYKARNLISIATEIPGAVKSGNDIDGYLHLIRRKLEDLAITSGGENTVSLESVIPEITNIIGTRLENPGKIDIPFGIRDVDILTGGMFPGELWVLGSRPSMGKSATVVNALAVSPVPSLIFSLEMGRQSLGERLLSYHTDIPITDLRLGNISKKQYEQVKDASERIKSLPLFIDTNFYADVNYIEATIRKYVRNHGVKRVYIDYAQLLAERNEDATHALGRITRAMKLLAGDLEIAIVVLSQLSRDVEKRPDKRPILSDLRQSGNIEEDADLAIFLYRDVVYNSKTKDKDLMEFLIRKQRNGPIGVIMQRFIADTNKITGI